MGAATLLELARPRVRTSTEVGEATGYRVLGRVPRRSGGWEDPAVVAALRSARAAVAELSPAAVAVTSSVPGEGKTTVAVGLAIALARAGSSVLLVDGDVRQRGLSARFGFRPGTGAGRRPGLGAVLRGEAALDAALRPGPVPGLAVLPTAVETDGAALLAGRFERFLDGARQCFDVVIVDGPPLLVGGEGSEPLAGACDAALLVVARDTPAYLATDAATTLRALNGNVLGAVANGAHQPRFSQPSVPAISHFSD
jgi:Mrp family chromosome partitioning ATPase